RWTGAEDLVVGAPVANREPGEVEGLIGCFVNTLALRVDLAGAATWQEVVQRVRRASLAAFAHQAMPFEKLVEALMPERDAGATPLFQVVLALQSRALPETLAVPPGADRDAGAGLAAELAAVAIGTAKFDLTLEAEEAEADLVLTWEYCRDL